MPIFSPATKKESRLRLAIIGPAGSGKTYSALAVATALGGRIAVIDTERGSASKYSDKFKFDVLNMADNFSPGEYVAAIIAADKSGYDVIVVDSLSHAWMGKGGALEMVDNAAKRSQSHNNFTAWRDVTPQHNLLVDTMIQCGRHIIVTMRSKTEYVMEPDVRGKMIPRKVGLAPIQRDGLEYEFDVVGMMTDTNEFIVSKTRCSALQGALISKPGADLAKTLTGWLTDGVKQEPKKPVEKMAAPQPPVTTPPATPEQPVAPKVSKDTPPPPPSPTPPAAQKAPEPPAPVSNEVDALTEIVKGKEELALAFLRKHKWILPEGEFSDLSKKNLAAILAKPDAFLAAIVKK